MQELAGIIGAFGLVFSGFSTIVYKMWKDHSSLTSRAIDVIAANSAAQEKLSDALNGVQRATDANTHVTEKASALTQQTKDSFSQLLLELIHKGRNK